MKSRSFLVFILILSLVVVPSLQLALAASSSSSTSSTTTTTSTTTAAPKGPYNEKLDIYTAGSNDYFLVSLSPVSATKPGVVSAESVAGLSAYQLTAIKTTIAAPSSQLFWGDGYKVVKLPFFPNSGVFLNVTATSQSAAQAAATDFNTFLATNFVQIGSSGGNYTFFSPADFTVAGETIFTSVPAAYKGLAGITSGATLATQPTPTAILTGVRSGSSFTHTVTFGSTETHAVGANASLSLVKALNQANSTFKASANATSTQVVVHSLDGMISSTDAAKITNNEATFSGTYSISVAPNTVFKPNVTILQDPPVLTATRVVDRGSAVSGDLISVTLLLRDTALNGTIQNISMNDNWWTSYPTLFSLSAGNSSFTGLSLSAGQNVSRVYVLKVLSGASQDLILPAAKASYSYGIGTVTVNASTKTNQVELRTNDIGPALMVQASADIKSGSPIGTLGHYIVTVTNIGNGPALNVKVANFTNPTLPQGGGAWTVNTTLPLNSIVFRNLTQTFTVGWTAPDGSGGTLVSNPANVILSHSGILLPLVQFNVAATLTPGVLALGSSNATYTVSNIGNAAANSVSVTQTFATGMICKSILNGTATCTSSGISLTTSSLAPGSNLNGKILVTFSNDNYLGLPGLITTTYSGLTLHTAGASFIVPAGVSVTRTDSPNPVFQNENDTVTIRVTNHGTLPIYNVSVTTQPDAFDTATSGVLFTLYPVINASISQTFNYTLGIVKPGNHTTAAVSLAFAFGGYSAAYTVFPKNVLVFGAVLATTSTTPSAPIEGSDFSLDVTVQNPSSVDVTNVSLSVPIPQGLTIVSSSPGLEVKGRTATLSLPSLAAGAASSNTLILRAGSDGSINLGNGSLTFQYLGNTIKGIVSTPAIVVGVDLLLRYELPIGAAFLLTVAVAVYMHRKLAVPQAR
jgi:uncharacterized repeat protein (TIGR01451 family)